jgi:ribosome-binding protein aMBF1 (putative translation factor)
MHDYTNIPRFPRPRRAARCSNPMTEELAGKAKTMVIRLGMAQHEVAAKLGVNQARVNEAVHGKIFPNAAFAPISDVM